MARCYTRLGQREKAIDLLDLLVCIWKNTHCSCFLRSSFQNTNTLLYITMFAPIFAVRCSQIQFFVVGEPVFQYLQQNSPICCFYAQVKTPSSIKVCIFSRHLGAHTFPEPLFLTRVVSVQEPFAPVFVWQAGVTAELYSGLQTVLKSRHFCP